MAHTPCRKTQPAEPAAAEPELELAPESGTRGFGHVDEFEGRSLVSSQTESALPRDPVAAMRELYAVGDVEGALMIAATITRPTWPPSGERGSDVSISIDVDIDVSLPPDPALTLAQRHAVVRVVKRPSEISRLPLDHRAGFLLAFIDGIQTVEDILDVCAMPVYEALGLIATLSTLGVIELRNP